MEACERLNDSLFTHTRTHAHMPEEEPTTRSRESQSITTSSSSDDEAFFHSVNLAIKTSESS